MCGSGWGKGARRPADVLGPGTFWSLAITISAAAQGNLGLAAGNLIGGIAMQTMVLVVCEIAVGSSGP